MFADSSKPLQVLDVSWLNGTLWVLLQLSLVGGEKYIEEIVADAVADTVEEFFEEIKE